MTRDERLIKFFETALERQVIYAQKELGCPKPWSQDSQFNTWYFCNVFRPQDKVTKWIIDNICEPYADDPDLWKKVVLARRISRIETLEALKKVNGFEDLVAGKEELYRRKNMGLPIITNAFITGIPDPSLGSEKIGFTYNLIDFYEKKNILPRSAKLDTICECTLNLMDAPNMGGFMSYEITSDFTYCKQYLKNAKDLLTWANPGPGCIRGINYIEFGSASIKTIKAKTAEPLRYMRTYIKDWCSWLLQHAEEHKKMFIERTGNPINGPLYITPFYFLTMREVEHWLCEFDKHERIGRNKRQYPL